MQKLRTDIQTKQTEFLNFILFYFDNYYVFYCEIFITNMKLFNIFQGEFYAIETFGTTGRGWVVEEGECSHYMKVRAYAHSFFLLQFQIFVPFYFHLIFFLFFISLHLLCTVLLTIVKSSPSFLNLLFYLFYTRIFTRRMFLSAYPKQRSFFPT